MQAPTRGTATLDHVLMSEHRYEHVKVIKPTANSDHKAIVAYSGRPVANPTKERNVFTYRKKSPSQNSAFLAHLSTLDPCVFIPSVLSDTQLAFDQFYAVTTSLLNQFYPEKTVTITSSDPPFVTPEIKSALRQKNKLMHKGRLEQADSLATKIGTLITKQRCNQLKQLKPGEPSSSL